MKIIKSIRELLREEKARNEALKAELEKAKATTEFVAIMADIEIPSDEEETENE